MSRIVFISPYLKGGRDAAALSNRTRYIATREGVEKLQDNDAALPPTSKQGQFIERVLRQYPEGKETPEYEAYCDNPTRKTASDLIEQLWEQYVLTQGDRENYIDYVSHRPGVQSSGDHGLWDAHGKVRNLSAVAEEVAHHQGNVWTPVVTLRRADAERLGFTDAENWRAVINASLNEIADAYKIKPENLRWYAALHEKEVNYHIHMVIYSADPKEGYLTKDGIRAVKSVFARHIFEQDLISTYKQQTEYRNTLQREAESKMAELVRRMRVGTIQNERIETLTEELADRLRDAKGKKVYGYLQPATKRIVDAIVDELSRDERVAEAYSLWQNMREEVCSTYSSKPPERKPLSQQKEFKSVRNMVIREALKLTEQAEVIEDERMDDEPEEAEERYIEPAPPFPRDETAPRQEDGRRREPDTPDDESVEAEPRRAIGSGAKSDDGEVYVRADRYRKAKRVIYDESADVDEKLVAIAELEKLWDEGYAIAAHQLGKCFRDGLGVERDTDRATVWLRRCAEKEYDCSEYALGKLLLELGRKREGIDWLARAAKHENQFAQYRLGKVYLAGEQIPKDVDAALSMLKRAAKHGNQYAQYALGKLYLMGRDVPQDMDAAVEYLTRAAEQGNVYAQFFLDHRDDWQSASVGSAVLRMLHSMSRMFESSVVMDSTRLGVQIDRKRRRELLEKRIAMGHKPDDHEDTPQQTMR